MKKAIQIKGIVRDTSGQQGGDGSCEEMINLRHKNNVLVPVGQKRVETPNADYIQVFTHSWVGFENEIGVLSCDG